MLPFFVIPLIHPLLSHPRYIAILDTLTVQLQHITVPYRTVQFGTVPNDTLRYIIAQ